MRKVLVCNFVSTDGFFEGPGRNVMGLPFDVGFDDYNAERLRAADTLLVGRTTFEGLKSYWPPLAEDENAPPIEREVSKLNTAIEKVVVSDTLTEAALAPWDDTRIVRRADAMGAVRELKEGPGRDIIVFGSHVVWNALLEEGLVDEVHLMIGAGFVGAGTPVFEGTAPALLRLLDVRRLGDSSIVLAVYAPR